MFLRNMVLSVNTAVRNSNPTWLYVVSYLIDAVREINTIVMFILYLFYGHIIIFELGGAWCRQSARQEVL
jgi:hypothetical protein